MSRVLQQTVATEERLVALLDEAGKAAGQTVHEVIHSLVKKNHHFSSKDDSDKVPSLHELVADYLLSHGVILPPCKVGDKVWYYDYVPTTKGLERIIRSSEVNQITIDSRCSFVTLANYLSLDLENFGKTVFLTREEAEEALEKLRTEAENGRQ